MFFDGFGWDFWRDFCDFLKIFWNCVGIFGHFGGSLGGFLGDVFDLF